MYGPNRDNPYFCQVREIIVDFNNDFNLVLDPALDLDNYKNLNNLKSREKIIEIIDDLNIINYYRILYPDERRYT